MGKIKTIIFFSFINIMNMLFLYMFPNSTPAWKNYSMQFIGFIYFLVISFFFFAILIYKFYRKYGSASVIETCYSVLFYVLLLGLLPGIYWWLQYNIESNIYPLERKIALIFLIASYFLYFSIAFIGLIFAFFCDKESKPLTSRIKVFFFLLSFFSSLFLSAIYVFYLFQE